MKKIISIIVLLVALVALGYVLSTVQSSDNSKKMTEYILAEEGLVFTYKNGPEGFVLEERTIDSKNTSDLLREILLTPTTDYEDQKTRVGGEGSPSWRLAVYNNNLNQSPNVWVDTHPLASNIKLLVGETRDVVVAGANAVAYSIDGLYRTDNVVIAHGGMMFVVSSSYLDDKSLTKVNFDSWINSFRFVPTKLQQLQSKIDVRVACESALIYMTFPNGEAAQKFVDECVEGKHPSVLERYIQELGVDGATI
jgi:hypothetical protein